MKRTIVFSAMAFVLLAAVGTIGQTTKRAQLIKFTKELETAPFSDDAKENRSWALRYVIETDDVSVTICTGDLTAVFIDKKNKYGSEILAQYTIGMAAFKLEFPDKSSDEDAAQLAGIESALRAYTSMVAAKPKAKHPGMDDLIAKRDRGELTKEKVSCGAKESK